MSKVKSRFNKKRLVNLLTVFLITILMIAATIFFFGGQGRSVPRINNGILNLTTWNENQGDVIPLNGKWEFYWNRFITYDEITQGKATPDLIGNAPEVWNNYRINGESIPGFGYGTYVLKVTGAEAGKQMGLWLPTFSTAYRLYINRDLLASNGIVSAQKSKGVAQYSPQKEIFTPSTNKFTILIQVSNYTYARGGMWYTLYLGTAVQISEVEKEIISRDFFLIGCFLLMGIVFMSIFLNRKQEKSSLYFALLCLMAIGRTIIYGAYSINDFLPFNNFETIVHIDYLIVAWFPGVIALLVMELFKSEIHKRAVHIFIAYGMVATMFFLFTPISLFTKLVYLIQAADLFAILYLFICIIAAILHGDKDAGITFIGLMAIMIGFVHDLLFQNNQISGGFFELSPIGFFIMLTLESYVLASRFTAVLRKNEEALTMLRLSTQRERDAELKFLKAQIRPHFLHNSLNTIISVSRKDIDRSRDLLIEFSSYLRGCFDFGNLDDEIPLENELEFIRSYVTLEQARFGDKLKVEYDIDETGLMVPPLILQPLVENAVVHGIRPKPDGGNILIYVKRNGSLIRFGVRDDGVGISQERIPEILSGTETARGVGINNINRRLMRLYGVPLQIFRPESGGLNVFAELKINGGDDNDACTFGGR